MIYLKNQPIVDFQTVIKLYIGLNFTKDVDESFHEYWILGLNSS